LQFLKNKLAVTLVFLLMAIVIVLNRNTTQTIGVNYSVTEYEIPLYLKLYNFYGRHLNYDHLVSEITKNSNNDQDKVINISKWINSNIKKLPKNVDIIDSHPLTIVERRLGKKGQFSDLLSVLLVYADIDAFLWSDKNNYEYVLTSYKVNGQWSIIDPYYGLLFINSEKHVLSMEEIKNGNWELHTLDLKEINISNFKKIFNNRFNNINQVKEFYKKQIDKIPTQEMINNTSVFELGGRAYTQSPLNRLIFVIRNVIFQ